MGTGQLRVQRPPIRNISDLCDRCLNIWYNLSPANYQGLVASMPRRVEAVLYAKGGCGSLAVMVSNSSHELQPCTTKPMHIKHVEAQTFSKWCRLEARTGCQLRCRPRHLTMVYRQTPSSS
ncbi:transposase domain containing protein [Trichonephila clavipes]|nr:transposase domain containing protein [Trichonephila clavipes]